MAGRGTDISLGGGDKEEEKKVKELGGLYVIGTERHENRRIDNQLRGRAGRQGDPGTSRFYVSLEDEIMRLYGSAKGKKLAEKLDDNAEITDKKLLKDIEIAQKALEGKNFGIRKNVLQYDDVINKQRELIYKDRRKVLNGEDILEEMKGMMKIAIKEAVDTYISKNDTLGYIEYINRLFKINRFGLTLDIENKKEKQIIEHTIEIVEKAYEVNEENLGSEYLRNMERQVLLQVVDKYWIEHIDEIDQLKKCIGLAAIGQKDPVKEFTVQSFDIFDDMNKQVRLDTLNYLFGLQVSVFA